MRKIIIIEDDSLLNKTLAYNLISDGYEVISAYTCAAARGLLKDNYNLALLDINLPDGNGFDLCTEIKERNAETYIIFLTTNDKESDMLKGYEVGGADYITKPFSVAVLCKKIAAVFETMEQHHPRHDLYEDDFLKIDFSEQSATLGGKPIDLTPKEYRTLLLFVKNKKLILTKTQLLEKLWDIDGDFRNRKREFGVLKAVGATQDQLKTMLQKEIAIYLMGSLIISFLSGTIVSSVICKRLDVVNHCITYRYPWVFSIGLVLMLSLIQFMFSWYSGKASSKTNILDAVRTQ